MMTASATMTDRAHPLLGKTALITGGTAGIGLVTARQLARRGANVVIVGRDAPRGQAAVAAIDAAAGTARARFIAADLSSIAAIHDLATAVCADHPRLDVLLNNAGGMWGKRTLSPDGIEMTFAVNHLAYFALTLLLLPALQAAEAGRVVVVASEAHRRVRLDFGDLEGERGYHAWRAYKRSKLANLLFTYALARRLRGGSVTVNALHPGFVATDIGTRHAFVPSWLWRMAVLAAIDVEKGAETSVYLASAADVASISGRYFTRCREAVSSAASREQLSAEHLWRESAKRTGLGLEEA